MLLHDYSPHDTFSEKLPLIIVLFLPMIFYDVYYFITFFYFFIIINRCPSFLKKLSIRYKVEHVFAMCKIQVSSITSAIFLIAFYFL